MLWVLLTQNLDCSTRNLDVWEGRRKQSLPALLEEIVQTIIRRLLNGISGCMLNDSVEISSSVALYGRLFGTKTFTGTMGRLTRAPIYHVLYHAPTTLDPRYLNLATLELDGAEAMTFDEVQENDRQRWMLSRDLWPD